MRALLCFERSAEPELMDDLAIQGPELARTLDEIEVINRSLGAYPPTVSGVRALLPEDCRRFSMLDVGVGGGDMARRVVAWADRAGRTAEILGIDLADTTVAYARSRCAGFPTIRVERQDLFDLPDAPTFDVVHAAQVLHHFPGESARRALSKMTRLARFGVVINDLHRHPVAWAAIRGLTAALSKNRLIRYDAPLSVRRGFDRSDLEALGRSVGARSVEVTWCPLFRWRLLLRA